MSGFNLGRVWGSTSLINVATIVGLLSVCDMVMSRGTARQIVDTMDKLTTPKPQMSDMGLNNGSAGYTPDYMGRPN